MSTLQENQSLNAEYERNQKIRILEERLEEYQKYIDINHKEIERLNNIINKLDKLIEQCSKRDYYFKYNGKYLKSEIINDLKTIRGVDKDNE